MSRPDSSPVQERPSLKALERRAKAILKARPAYKEMVGFYMAVFRLQIKWRDKVEVFPEKVDADKWKESVKQGQPLIESCDPGIESDSLIALWSEMKEVFAEGNDVLRNAVDKISSAEAAGDLSPGVWLLEQRPDRSEWVADTARNIGVDEPVLATLTRATTFPHWEKVTQAWLASDVVNKWKRFRCPICGGPPGLAENRRQPCAQEGLTPPTRRFVHCPFCAARWGVAMLDCPACGSTKSGDAKYYFTADEPDVRIDFCKSCQHYIKVVDGDKVTDPVHVGLELLTTTHLDVIAQEKKLSPLEVCT